jgi:hypothetical protein
LFKQQLRARFGDNFGLNIALQPAIGCTSFAAITTMELSTWGRLVQQHPDVTGLIPATPAQSELRPPPENN